MNAKSKALEAKGFADKKERNEYGKTHPYAASHPYAKGPKLKPKGAPASYHHK